MKRLTIICITVFLLCMIIGLSQTAINPGSFCGEWYSSDDQRLHMFREGLIFSTNHGVIASDVGELSGAYTFNKDSIFLFANGIEGLETEKKLYLVTHGDSSFLCENIDGSGKIYFIRYNP